MKHESILAIFRIARGEKGWVVEHGRNISTPHPSRVAAFESVIELASNCLKNGEALRIEVDTFPSLKTKPRAISGWTRR